MASLLWERTPVCEKHICMKMSFNVSTPPVTVMSDLPVISSRIARFMAPMELAQAASTTQFVPPRSRRLVILPAITFPRSPGNEFSCQGTYAFEILSMTSSARSASIPESRRAFRQIGCPSLAPRGMTSSCVPVAPRITLVLSRLNFLPMPYPASSSAFLATTRLNNCEVSVASSVLGGIPNSAGSYETGGRNPPFLQ